MIENPISCLDLVVGSYNPIVEVLISKDDIPWLITSGEAPNTKSWLNPRHMQLKPTISQIWPVLNYIRSALQSSSISPVSMVCFGASNSGKRNACYNNTFKVSQMLVQQFSGEFAAFLLHNHTEISAMTGLDYTALIKSRATKLANLLSSRPTVFVVIFDTADNSTVNVDLMQSVGFSLNFHNDSLYNELINYQLAGGIILNLSTNSPEGRYDSLAAAFTFIHDLLTSQVEILTQQLDNYYEVQWKNKSTDVYIKDASLIYEVIMNVSLLFRFEKST
ncbi:hypothetical protein Ciccas_005541 [Cichlidogyrus casuarinus]|uniref:Uncharacterized protein n=1 Tax=Cichlidogyrus casuarinus TaxID=1844966 RepID=A0ABD2QC01_9PLAT